MLGALLGVLSQEKTTRFVIFFSGRLHLKLGVSECDNHLTVQDDNHTRVESGLIELFPLADKLVLDGESETFDQILRHKFLAQACRQTCVVKYLQDRL
jgi:hypothetical protein